ncbi:MAG: aspartyl protease family protein [Acidobacteriota bacterium]
MRVTYFARVPSGNGQGPFRPASGLREGPAAILGSNREFAEQAAFYPNLPFLLIRLGVQGEQLALVLDTGSPYLIFFRREIADGVDVIRTKERERIAHAAGNLDLQKVILGETQLGEHNLGAVTAYLMDASGAPYGGADGILGPTSLGLQRLHLDFESRRVSWEF